MANSEGRIKKILGSKWTMFLVLLGFMWLSVRVVDVYYRKYKINKEMEGLKNQIGNLEKSNQEISGMIEYLGSQSFLEKEAREKLNLKKEGEQVVVIEQPKENSTTTTEPAEGQGKADSQQSSAAVSSSQAGQNFVKWWRFFFK